MAAMHYRCPAEWHFGCTRHIDKKHGIVSGQEKCPKSEMKAPGNKGNRKCRKNARWFLYSGPFSCGGFRGFQWCDDEVER